MPGVCACACAYLTSVNQAQSSKNRNHSLKLLLNKLKATNQQKVTKYFQNYSRLRIFCKED